MKNWNRFHKCTSLFLAVILLLAAVVMPVSAEEDVNTYVFHRDGNGEYLYLYQSPCVIDYDLNNKLSYNQVFVFIMYNTITGEHFPTYCTDIETNAEQGALYRRMNLEYSPFAGSAAGKIRAILQNGFYIIPIEGESDADHAARVTAKTAALGTAAGIEDLTTGEAIAATQAAIWKAAHGSELTFPRFCRPSLNNPQNTKYKSLCSYDVLKLMDNALINSRIETVYNYLLSLAPVAATSQVVSASSFLKMENLVITDNGDDTYTVSVDVTVDVDMEAGDSLKLYTMLGETPSGEVSLRKGQQTHTLTIPKASDEEVSSDIKLFISGTQTVSGFFYFDAEGGREAAQAMVAYDSSTQPIFLELTAAPKEGGGGEPDIPDVPVTPTGGVNLLKVDAVKRETPLAGATFEVYRPADAEEINANGENLVTLPGLTAKMVKVAFYNNPDLTGDQVTSVTTGDDGKAAIYGLTYGTYYLMETQAPAGYNLMAECKELTIDATSHTEENTITIENESGAVLPATGGIGTTAYTAGGMALICIACLCFYGKKRREAE